MINNRLHDRLQQLANGELDPKQEAAVRAEISQNPEALSLLSQYTELRSSLTLLQDVPPDQLSKERLRSKLLGQALRTERPAPLWTWFWMPTAAAAMAFVVYFNRTKPAEAPNIVGSPSLASNLPARADQGSTLSKAFATPSAKPLTSYVAKVTTPAPISSSVDPSNVETNTGPIAHEVAVLIPKRHSGEIARSARRHAKAHEPTSNIADIPADATAWSDLNNVARTALNTANPEPEKVTALAAPVTATTSPESIVVISNSVDADTGAQHATEETASNVLVGG